MNTCVFCKAPEDQLGLKCGVCFGCAIDREKEGVFDACLAGTFDFSSYVAAGGKQAGTTIQTLILAKESFPTQEEAVAWIERNDFRSDKIDETENSWRFRQREPGDFREDAFPGGGQFRTVQLRPGVQAVIGFLTDEAMMSGPDKAMHTHRPHADGGCMPGFRRRGNLCVKIGSPLDKDEPGKSFDKQVFFKIAMIDEVKRIVFGPVLVPNEVDLQGDFEFREDIEAAAHSFLLNRGKIGEQHQIFQGIGDVVESHVLREPMTGAKDEVLAVGTWMMGVKITNDPTWQRVLRKELNGFSIGFRGQREGVS